MTSPPLADLPVDALVLLIGPAGAGKSTWALRHMRSAAVLSSDDFRALVADDATDQSATADAFRTLHAVARARLRRGLLTVVDATNLTASARQGLRRIADRARRPVLAIVFDVSLERCLVQNAARPDRRVPDDVVRRHHRQLREALAAVPGEGYREVHILDDADLASG